jgi:ABC-type uncharacterized transport system permease subunit
MMPGLLVDPHLLQQTLVYASPLIIGPKIAVGPGLYVLGIGLSSLLFRAAFGVRTSPPQIPTLPSLPLPGLAELPVIGPMLFRHTVLAYVALGLVPLNTGCH